MKRKIITVDLRELSDDFSRRDYVYIFYNEYCMHALNGEKSYELKVFTYGDEDIEKLKRALKKYGADKDYIKTIKESKIENKFNDTKMKKKFVNESASVNPEFTKAFVTVASNNDDEDLRDTEYLFGDEYHYIDDIIDEIENITGERYDSEDDFYSDVIANAADIMRNPKARVLYDAIADYDDMNEYPSTEVEEPRDSEEEDERDEDSVCLDVVQDAYDNGEITTEDDLEDKLDDIIMRVNPDADSLSDDEYNELVDEIREAWNSIKRSGASSYDDFEEDEDFVSHRNRKGGNELRRFSDDEYVGEGFVYAKIDDVINEAREEGRREALKEMRGVNNDYTRVNEAKKEVPLKIRKEDLRIAKQTFADKVKELRNIAKIKGFADLTKYGETFDAQALTDAYNEFFRGAGKEISDRKKEVIGIIRELKKLNTTIGVISAAIEDSKEATKSVSESVTSKFSKFRDEFRKINESEEEEDKETSDDKGKKTQKKGEDSEEEEEIDIPAVVLTVKKDAVDKCKQDMIDAGVEEDDIEVLEPEDDDEEEVEIKIDTNSIMALKDYLDSKGIDLEDKLGVTIEGDDEDEEENKEDKKDKDSDEDDEDDDDSFDELDDDFFANLGNIGDEDEEDKKEDKE